MKFSVSVTGHPGENLAYMCWFYVKNCIFVHMTDKIFQVTLDLPLRKPGIPKVEVLELPLTLHVHQ